MVVVQASPKKQVVLNCPPQVIRDQSLEKPYGVVSKYINFFYSVSK